MVYLPPPVLARENADNAALIEPLAVIKSG